MVVPTVMPQPGEIAPAIDADAIRSLSDASAI
jgi:hypothetical protein